MSNFILPIPKSFPSHRQRATNTFLRQPQQRNCRLSREVSLGDFRNAQQNRSPQNPITRQRKSLEASQKHNWRTQSPSWHPKLNLVSIKWFSQQLSIPELPDSSEPCFNLNITVPEDTMFCKSSVHAELYQLYLFFMGTLTFVLRTILFQRQT